ncbi:MAG: hypothetical protein ACXW3L_11010 [Limisphaerales bacterium]
MDRPPENLRWQDVQQISFERLTIIALSGEGKDPTVYEFPTIEEMVAFYQGWSGF